MTELSNSRRNASKACFLPAALAILFFFHPLLRGSWDPWAQTLIHSLTAIVAIAALTSKNLSRVGNGFAVMAAFIWAGVSAVSFTFSRFPHSASWGFLNDLNAVLFFLLAARAASDRVSAELLAKALAGSLVVLNAVSLLLAVTPSSMTFADPARTLINPGVLAAFNILALPVVFYLSVTREPSLAGAFWRVGCLISLVALAATRSASAVVALVVQGGAWVYFRPVRPTRGQKILLATAVILSVITVAVSFMIASSDVLPFQRGHWMLAGLRMFLDHSVIGAGSGTFGEGFPGYRGPRLDVQNTLYAHNFLIEMLAERGLFGAGIFLLFIVSIGRDWWKNQIRTGDRSLASMIGIGIGGFLLFNLANFGMSVPSLAWAFWAFAGILAVRGGEEGADEMAGKRPLLGQAAARVIVILASVFLLGQSWRLFRADQFTAKARFSAREDAGKTKELCAKAIKWEPKSPEAYSLLAAVLWREEDHEAALMNVERAISFSPFTPRFRAEKASYLERLGRLDALDEYRIATDLNPLDSDIWLRRGDTALALGHPDEARTSYEKIVQLNEVLYPRLFAASPWRFRILERAKEQLRAIEEGAKRLPDEKSIMKKP